MRSMYWSFNNGLKQVANTLLGKTLLNKKVAFSALGEMSLVPSASGPTKPAVWLGGERCKEADRRLTAGTALLSEVSGRNGNITTSDPWPKELAESIAALSKRLSIADSVGTLQKEDQVFIQQR